LTDLVLLARSLFINNKPGKSSVNSHNQAVLLDQLHFNFDLFADLPPCARELVHTAKRIQHESPVLGHLIGAEDTARHHIFTRETACLIVSANQWLTHCVVFVQICGVLQILNCDVLLQTIQESHLEAERRGD